MLAVQKKSAKNVQKILPVTLYCADIKMTENVATSRSRYDGNCREHVVFDVYM